MVFALIVLIVFGGVECTTSTSAACDGETLFNGVCLSKSWPPHISHSHASGGQSAPPPYLTSPPDGIDVSVGRQLFVDGFLIDNEETMNIVITHHSPKYRDDVNPVVRPDKVWEGADLSKPIDWNATVNVEAAFASPFSGGLFWDPAVQMYKLWYRCGANEAAQCYATSLDGISWDKPILKDAQIPHTNIIQKDAIDGSTVWLDLDEADPTKRYKMASVFAKNHYDGYTILTSSDGINWNVALNKSGPIADRSSVFLNPMRSPRQWVFSIKQMLSKFGRSRGYWESEDLAIANWTINNPAEAPVPGNVYNWTSADAVDPPFVCSDSWSGDESFTQLYNLDAVAYESIIVGLFSIFTGKYCSQGGNVSNGCPLMNRTGEWDSVFVGYSRDGFHWTRPLIDGKHKVFMDMDATPVKCVQGTTNCDWRWNKANVQSVGGGFTVQNTPSIQTLRFYVGARTGAHQISGNATTGLAEMRRDGFASVAPITASSQAVLITRTLMFNDRAQMFVNVEGTNTASVVISIIDAITKVPVVGLENGVVDKQGERVMVKFDNINALQALSGKQFRVRFNFGVSSDVALFSFWFSSDECGASQGWVAAGGMGFNSSRDTIGDVTCAVHHV